MTAAVLPTFSAAPKKAPTKARKAQRKPAPKKPGLLTWNVISQFSSSVVWGERLLVLGLTFTPQDSTWTGIALEGPRKCSPQEILNNHAHKVIGRFRSLASAQSAAEKFAVKWLTAKGKLPTCSCEDIL